MHKPSGLAMLVGTIGFTVLLVSSIAHAQIEGALQYPPPSVGEDAQPPPVLSRSVLEIDGAVSGRMRIRGQAARSIGLLASFWFRVCHPSTLRMVI